MLVLVVIQLMLTSGSYSLTQEQFNEQQVIYLQVNNKHVQHPLTLIQSIYSRNLHIYCRNEQRMQLANIFQSNCLQLITEEPNAKYIQYKESTAHAVYRSYLQGDECHEGKLMCGRTKQVHYISLPAHSQACYGIFTNQAYNLTLLQKQYDEVCVGRFTLGIILWMTASQVGECLVLCYTVAIALGVYLASLGVVCLGLLFAGDLQLKSLQPLGANFKLLLEGNTTIVTLALVGGVWVLVKFYQQYRSLRRYRLIRCVHFRAMRLLSYALIRYSSDHQYFGWICVSLLLPWPELYWLIHWLRIQGVKIKRICFPPHLRRLLSEQEFEAQSAFETQRVLKDLRERLYSQSPKWEQVAQLHAPQNFARFVCSGTVAEEETQPCDNQSENVASSLLKQLTAAINSNSNNTCESVQSLYRNLHYSGSTRSLRTDPRQN